jgi:DNA-binding NtrC family response regulator
MPYRILIVDNDDESRSFLIETMKARGYDLDALNSSEDALAALKKREYDLTVIDIAVPDAGGTDAIARLRQANPDAIVIVMTASDSKQLAVDAMRAGAYDYFTKPVKMDDLGVVIERALEKRRLQKELNHLNSKLKSKYTFENIVGNSGPMQEVFALVDKVVDSDVTVLICGESGTGKELIAQAIHNRSLRRDDPFVKLNCVAIPEGLLESELFGHEKGSFTGAAGRKLGKFELANTGTIFLDEIGDMSLATQAKILRVLQEKEFERVGGTETVRIDVRVIAATNKDLHQAVEKKEFREDLYFRLNVFGIVMPALRVRKEDIPLLVEHFLGAFRRKTHHPWRRREDMPLVANNIACAGPDSGPPATVTKEAMDLLLAYHWPGNVRELENCIQRALVMADADIIGPDCLPPHIQHAADSPSFTLPTETASIDQTLLDVEKQLVVDALYQTSGIQSKAARILGITERSLWHRVKKLDVDVAAIKNAT